MNKILLLIAAGLCLLASCKKAEQRDLDKSRKRLLGMWTVESISLRTTDTLGALLGDTTIPNPGTVEFIEADESASGIGAFDRALFEGPCSKSELVGYFSGNNAGDPTSTGGWSLCWDADPEGLRLQFWGVNGGGSLHRSLNLQYEGKGKNTQQLYYIVQTPGVNLRSIYTWQMRK